LSEWAGRSFGCTLLAASEQATVSWLQRHSAAGV
jgi:hypothetical protein